MCLASERNVETPMIGRCGATRRSGRAKATRQELEIFQAARVLVRPVRPGRNAVVLRSSHSEAFMPRNIRLLLSQATSLAA